MPTSKSQPVWLRAQGEEASPIAAAAAAAAAREDSLVMEAVRLAHGRQLERARRLSDVVLDPRSPRKTWGEGGNRGGENIDGERGRDRDRDRERDRETDRDRDRDRDR
jgi:hypothetical protein